MNKQRSVRKVIPAVKVDMGGHLLDQPLPAAGIDQIDPFLLIHHWKEVMPGGHKPQEVGVGPHPHRGFSPVTFVFSGEIQHRDSLGRNAIVGAGGTQWMHSGRGITHSERPSAKMAEQGGLVEFIQFWINSPAAHKMDVPHYQPISREDTPMIEIGQSKVFVVAGKLEDTEGPARTLSPQTLLRVHSDAGSSIRIPIPEDHNAIVYLLDGQLEIDGHTMKDKDMAWMAKDGHSIEIEITMDSRYIVLAGQPLDEKVTSYGPFVMNTQTEIMEAIRDAQMGKMGILIEEF